MQYPSILVGDTEQIEDHRQCGGHAEWYHRRRGTKGQ